MIGGVNTGVVVNNEKAIPWFLYPFFFVLVGIRFGFNMLDRFIADSIDCLAILPLEEDHLPRQRNKKAEEVF